jgi:hypothetical protein
MSSSQDSFENIKEKEANKQELNLFGESDEVFNFNCRKKKNKYQSMKLILTLTTNCLSSKKHQEMIITKETKETYSKSKKGFFSNNKKIRARHTSRNSKRSC